MAKEIKKIGDILIKRKYITKKQLEKALSEQGDKPLGQTLIDMGYVKENECGESIEEVNDCSNYKILDTYKVIRTKTSVMHGSGVEYGERNTIWLAEGLGIVKDKLEIRWTGENGNIDNWTEYSRLELKSIQNSDSGFNLGRMFNSGKILDINSFGNEEDLNNDPYIPQPTAIIQRVRTDND